MVERILTLVILIISIPIFSQDYYSELRKKYWQFDENDVKAFNYINLYIVTAKKQKNYPELFQAYDDAIKFSSKNKLQYADSAISAAKLSGNKDLIANAYLGKGTVYYFTYRKFQPALKEYLLAEENLKTSSNLFLKYQNLYHIGVVKSYLGYYQEASEIFKKCIIFFKSNLKPESHPNLIFNNSRGYYNSVHQLVVCYQAMKRFKEAGALIKTVLPELSQNNQFDQEKSYFNKSVGVNSFYSRHFDKSIYYLNISLPGLKKVNDFSWASTVYMYLGLCYSAKGQNLKAIENYTKVDSIFKKYNFIVPEVRKNYEELIRYYKNSENQDQELKYTKQLLKVDSIISNDFKYLSTKIHKDYETKTLLESKAELEDSNTVSRILLLLLSLTMLILFYLVYYWITKKKNIQKKYDDLVLQIDNIKYNIHPSLKESEEKSFKLDVATVTHLKKKFAKFEETKGFLEKGITAGKLAIEFETNSTYFSQFLSEFKESNFNTYINRLRVNYAAEQIYHNKNWRKYSVETIAAECGFSNRQRFSNFFFEQHGIRPADFLKKIKEEKLKQRNSI